MPVCLTPMTRTDFFFVIPVMESDIDIECQNSTTVGRYSSETLSIYNIVIPSGDKLKYSLKLNLK